MAADRLHHFTLLTAAEIENTPSRRDGVSAAKEARLWKKMGISIFETAKMMLPAMYVACLGNTTSTKYQFILYLPENMHPTVEHNFKYPCPLHFSLKFSGLVAQQL